MIGKLKLLHKEQLMTTKVTRFGHATMGVETSGYPLIIDPFFRAILLSPKTPIM